MPQLLFSCKAFHSSPFSTAKPLSLNVLVTCFRRKRGCPGLDGTPSINCTAMVIVILQQATFSSWQDRKKNRHSEMLTVLSHVHL